MGPGDDFGGPIILETSRSSDLVDSPRANLPFAMDGDGNLYTPDPADREVLEQLDVADWMGGGEERPTVRGAWDSRPKLPPARK